MTPSLAAFTISKLSVLSVTERDAELCRMHSGHWVDLATALNIRLPLWGGDVPVILGAAIARLRTTPPAWR